jgi:hypothetical protein
VSSSTGGTRRHARPEVADLAAARARWQARPFSAYRLTLTIYEPEPPGGCQQELVIRDEQVVDPCQVGSVCRRVREVQVTYDPLPGYPHVLRVAEQNRPNWRHPATWQHLLQYGRPPDYPMLGGSFSEPSVQGLLVQVDESA